MHTLLGETTQLYGELYLKRPRVTIDGNEAAAYVAHLTNEVIAIYPITPSSAMGEWADQWSASGSPNIWGTVPTVVEMQSEGGAAGAVHGSLQAGSLTTTFTSSQGLLLMIPNMYKIAGELTPAVFHVAARAIAAQGLSIFGDHQDVMAVRATGFAMLASHSVQSVMDMALIAQTATLESRIPFVHFFDGFRTSHEVAKVEQLTPDDMRAMITADMVRGASRTVAQSRPAGAARHGAESGRVFPGPRNRQSLLPGLPGDRAARHGPVRLPHRPAVPPLRLLRRAGCGARRGADGLERVRRRGVRGRVERARRESRASSTSICSGRSPRRLSWKRLPPTVRAIAVLDRTKEPGSLGEPLYLDVVTALYETARFSPHAPRSIGGRYGLGSKEFTPAMVKAVFDGTRVAQAAEALCRRHQRRCDASQPAVRSLVLDRESEHGPGRFLWPGRRRYGGRQQEFHQDHRRRDRPFTRKAISSTTRRSPAP